MNASVLNVKKKLTAMNNLKKECQYKFIGCKKTAEFRHFIKLDFHKLDKGYICSNCKQIKLKTNAYLWKLNN